MSWYPHVTVATVVENDGKFLLVEELSHGQIVLNQPAGHLEQGESLIDAAIREAREETAWEIEVLGILSFGLYTSPNNQTTYHRTTFYGKPLHHHVGQALDDGILRADWFSPEDIRASRDRLRSPLVLSSMERFLSGVSYPLALLHD